MIMKNDIEEFLEAFDPDNEKIFVHPDTFRKYFDDLPEGAKRQMVMASFVEPGVLYRFNVSQPKEVPQINWAFDFTNIQVKRPFAVVVDLKSTP